MWKVFSPKMDSMLNRTRSLWKTFFKKFLFFVLFFRLTVAAELLNKPSAAGRDRGQAGFLATKFRLIIFLFLHSFHFKEAFCVLMIVLWRGPEGCKSEIWIYGFMQVLDTSFDHCALICRDLDCSNSMKFAPFHRIIRHWRICYD